MPDQKVEAIIEAMGQLNINTTGFRMAVIKAPVCVMPTLLSIKYLYKVYV